MFRSGTGFTSMAILFRWQDTTVQWHYIARGDFWQNGFVESSNGRFCDES
ncbi:integrase core domain-containing protein [Tabrizicola sp.]